MTYLSTQKIKKKKNEKKLSSPYIYTLHNTHVRHNCFSFTHSISIFSNEILYKMAFKPFSCFRKKISVYLILNSTLENLTKEIE